MKSMRPKHFAAILVLLAITVPVFPAQAAGTVTECTPAGLQSALNNGGVVLFACSGTIRLTVTLSINYDTILDASGQSVTLVGPNADRVFWVSPGKSLTLRNLTIANGTAPSGAGGGGVYVNVGTLIIDRTTFSGNTATTGGAVYLKDGTLDIDHSSFSGNSATSGGAVYVDSGTVTVDGSSFLNNMASGGTGEGGGIYVLDGPLTVGQGVFDGNSAQVGGGICYIGPRLMVTGSEFRYNRTSYLGGAIYTQNSQWANSTVSNSNFYRNSADPVNGWGGAIMNYYPGLLTVSNSRLSDNTAAGGGAIRNLGWKLTVRESTLDNNSALRYSGGAIHGGYNVHVSNSTFWRNTTPADGGAISLTSDEDSLTVTNSTFLGNGASGGGASIFNLSGTATLENTIVASSWLGQNCSGAIIDGGGNLSWPDLSCPGINRDPLLGPFANNGGPTPTLALGPGSPAIDAADDAICAAGPIDNLDQRGATRPSGLHCDIGAVEQQPTAGPPIAIDIKPGSDANSIQCRNGNEVIAVAILTTDLFDATTVDHTTVTFHGAGEMHIDPKSGQPRRHEEDLDGDGDLDLVFHFRLGSTALVCQSTVAALWGETFAGEWIVGTDSVRMVGGD
jgi:predicted outer membrane repeat protein